MMRRQRISQIELLPILMNYLQHSVMKMFFGRMLVEETLKLKKSGASTLITKLLNTDMIEPVIGHGKWKYKFKKNNE